ncbi:hypothetical protein ASG01_14695 [Chryseobacterium sp. Leaf180]|nr:hypothetical protein ASG01_14695 [Chryseobacterium sp. Leaf180]
MPAGTEVYIVGLAASTYNPVTSTSTANGTVTLTEGTSTNGLSLSNVGDQIIAFQGGGGSVSAAGATNIAGINYFYTAGTTTAGWNTDAPVSPNASLMPPGLTGGTSAFYTGAVTGTTAPASGKFNCTGVPSSTASGVRTAVMNVANWSLSVSPIGLFSGCSFLAATPVITLNPVNKTVCSGSSTTFTVTATGAGSYQWFQNTASGFVALTNTAVFSGTATATLTVSGITSALNNTQYRCVVTSAAGSTTSTPPLQQPA